MALDEYLASRARRDENGCMIWLGFTFRGYAKASGLGEQLVHRAVYVDAYGPIADGLQIDHLCRNRSCVELSHLEAVTAAENNRRRDEANGTGIYKTHCKKGHTLAGDNLRVDRKGRRLCRTCRQAAQRQYEQTTRRVA